MPQEGTSMYGIQTQRLPKRPCLSLLAHISTGDTRQDTEEDYQTEAPLHHYSVEPFS